MRKDAAGTLVNVLLAIACASFAAHAVAVDEWDAGAIKDNTAASTRNELSREEWQIHDLEATGGVADEDWFIVSTTSFRTFQIFVSQITGDTPVDNADFLTLWDATGTTLLQTANSLTIPSGKLIWWASDASTNYRIRIKGGTSTPGTAKYSILFRETTMYCPRYNNAGTQVSVLIMQNTTNGNCPVFVSFLQENGSFAGGTNVVVPGAGISVLAASSVAGVTGTKGGVQILPSGCASTALKAKVVALEPATGFSFDTLCERR